MHGNGQPNQALESVRESTEADLHMAFHTQIVQVKELAGLRPQHNPESNGVLQLVSALCISDVPMTCRSILRNIMTLIPYVNMMVTCMHAEDLWKLGNPFLGLQMQHCWRVMRVTCVLQAMLWMRR